MFLDFKFKKITDRILRKLNTQDHKYNYYKTIEKTKIFNNPSVKKMRGKLQKQREKTRK